MSEELEKRVAELVELVEENRVLRIKLVEENRLLRIKLDDCKQNGMAMLPHQIRLYARLAQFMVEQNKNLLDADDWEITWDSPQDKADRILDRLNTDLNNYLSNHMNSK